MPGLTSSPDSPSASISGHGADARRDDRRPRRERLSDDERPCLGKQRREHDDVGRRHVLRDGIGLQTPDEANAAAEPEPLGESLVLVAARAVADEDQLGVGEVR